MKPPSICLLKCLFVWGMALAFLNGQEDVFDDDLQVVASGIAQPQGVASVMLEDFEAVRPAFRIGKSDALVRVRGHARSDSFSYRGRRSEFIWVQGNRGGERILATIDIAPVMAISELQLFCWLRGRRLGYQIMARVRLPRTLDAVGEPRSLYVHGDRYTALNTWQQLRVGGFQEQIDDQARAMRVATQSAVDASEAYVDQVVLNVYGGAGDNQVWIDDLAVSAAVPVPRKRVSISGANHLANTAFEKLSVEMRTTKPPEDWQPRVAVCRKQDLLQLAEMGFNTVWFANVPSSEHIEAAKKNQLLVIGSLSENSSSVSVSAADLVALASTQPDGVDASAIVRMADQGSTRWHEVGVDEGLNVNATGTQRWMRTTLEDQDRWLLVRRKLRRAVFHGYTGFVLDTEASLHGTAYKQAISELFNLELKILKPWMSDRERFSRFSQEEGMPFRVQGLFARHAGLAWIQSNPAYLPAASQIPNGRHEVDLPDALYRGVYYLQPGSLEPVRSRRIAGGVRVSLNHDKPEGMLLLSNQPQVLRAHQQYLRSIGKRYNELLTSVIRYELLAIDRQLANRISDDAMVGHLRQELHALHSRIAPVLSSRESLVNHRQLDHLLEQLERVQQLPNVRF